MKKLTAGIFATILGLTTVNAFAATAGTKVASTTYVDGAVAAANAYTDTKVGGIKIPSLDGYAKETWVEGKGYAVATTVAEDIATAKAAAASDATSKADAAQAAAIAAAAADATTKADAAQAAAIAAAATDAESKAGAAETAAKAYVDEKTKNMATDTVVAGKLDKSVYDADKPTFAIKTEVASEIASAVAGKLDTTTAEATYATQTSVSTVEGRVTANETAISDLKSADTALGQRIDEVVANAYDDTELAARVSTNETAITNLQSADATLQANIDKKLDSTTAATTYETIANAKAYAKTVDVEEMHSAQAHQIDAISSEITNLKNADTAFETEQAEQNAEIAKKANSADVYAKSVADTTFVKVSDIADSYPASN